MARAQVYLTSEERAGLEFLAKNKGGKISELIRVAVGRLFEQSLSARRDSVLKATAGLWKDRNDLPDFEAIRSERDRSMG
ncbi:MAG: CopG family transcriptional regulator [Candidatus Accumulibacter sp.]|nr:CopG family transcriptional regulator [Accumulibacter sp.]